MQTRLVLILACSVLLLATACEDTDGGADCEAGTQGCACYGNGTCNQGLSCTDGFCLATGADSSCTPACTGMECGPDGCGGRCGFCVEGHHCVEGRCTGEGSDTIAYDWIQVPDTTVPPDTWPPHDVLWLDDTMEYEDSWLIDGTIIADVWWGEDQWIVDIIPGTDTWWGDDGWTSTDTWWGDDGWTSADTWWWYDGLQEDVTYPDTTTTDPCGWDGYCNNASMCAGGSPKDWSTNTDPDCPCDCNYYSGVCESMASGTDVACPCDYDCKGDAYACDEDGHCDTWCPQQGSSSIDPDCPMCACDYYAHVCEAGAQCSTATCACDPDCEGGIFLACMADGLCDSWCPTDTDPDCAGDPSNGKYCN